MRTNVVPFAKKGEALPGRPDDELMLLASRGLQAAFEELVRRHSRRLLGFCAKHVGSPAAGEDLAVCVLRGAEAPAVERTVGRGAG